MPLLPDDFVPATGVTDAHAQTFLGFVARRAKAPALRRRRVTTADDDFLDLDILDGQEGLPTVLILHGLEGSSASGYVRHLLGHLAALEWSAVALNFRSCSGEPNLQLRSYSSGDTADALAVAQRLPGPLYAVGFSLGGSVLLNLLTRAGAQSGLRAAVTVSAPFDLDACATWLDSDAAFARVYRLNFVEQLRAKALEKARRFPGALDAGAIAAARTIRAFDAAVTAPSFGFDSAEAYYAAASTAGRLSDIAVPTLLVSAEDDPLAPARHLPSNAHQHPPLEVLVTARGGHVGFVAGSVLRPRFWAESRVAEWLAAKHAAQGGAAQPRR